MNSCNYCMQTMNQPYQQYEMAPQQQLEKMYPQTYNIIQPAVENACNNMHTEYGQMYVPTQEHMEQMIDKVYKEVEPEVYAVVRESSPRDERQFVGGGRRILRDLIGILLIRRLLGGVPYYGYSNYYALPGYNYPVYPPYPVYYNTPYLPY